MAYSKEEKLSIISQLLHVAKSDGKIKDVELTFIKAIAKTLQISEAEIITLIQQPSNKSTLKPESERILQFHRLILVMNVDQKTGMEEIDVIRNFGLKMGLSPTAINEVFAMMNNYENKMIPPQELLKVFKKHYN